MANKRNPKPPRNDFEYDEGEVSGFSDETAIVGDLIATFSVNDTSNNNIIQTNTTDPIETKNIISPTKDVFDNRRTPLANRATPSIDGETPTIKRTYTLRTSTIRKINELKHVHPDINVCVSSIVDIALDYYHNYILHEGGTQ